MYGILAQLGEHLPYKQRVTGSSPVGPIQVFLFSWKTFIYVRTSMPWQFEWRDSSVGKSTRFIPVVSGVQIPFPLLIGP